MPLDEAEYNFDASNGLASTIGQGLADIGHGLALWRTWGALGYRDFRFQSRRTLLGPLWSIVGTLITVVALGHVYGALLNSDTNQSFPFVAAGLIAWFFIAGCMQGGFSVFPNAAGLIKERDMPLSFSVFRYTWRLFIELCFKMIVFAIVAVVVGLKPGQAIFLLPLGLVLLLLNGCWVNLLFGVGGARYRDLGELMGPLMLIAFLATPVLWPQAALQSSQYLADFNPLTHYIAIIRDPLLGRVPDRHSVVIVLSLTVIGWLIAVPVFDAARSRIVFWM